MSIPSRPRSRLPAATRAVLDEQALMRFRTGFLMHDISVMRQALFERIIRPFSRITPEQAWLLIDLARHANSGMTQVDLARSRKVGKVAMGRMIDKLEEAGYVERIADAEDRRSKRIYLTSKAQELMNRMVAVSVEQTVKLAEGLTLERQQALHDSLMIMRRNLSAMDLESASTRRKKFKVG